MRALEGFSFYGIKFIMGMLLFCYVKMRGTITLKEWGKTWEKYNRLL